MKRLILVLSLVLVATIAIATTATRRDGFQLTNQSSVIRYTETSAANTELVVTATPGHVWRVMGVYVIYSSAVSKNVTSAIDSGAGAGYDLTVNTIALSAAASGVYEPTVERWYSADDSLVVTAPASGAGGVTGALAVYLEVRK